MRHKFKNLDHCHTRVKFVYTHWFSPIKGKIKHSADLKKYFIHISVTINLNREMEIKHKNVSGTCKGIRRLKMHDTLSFGRVNYGMKHTLNHCFQEFVK